MDSVIYKLMNNIYKYMCVRDIFNTFYLYISYFIYVTIISDEEITNVVRKWGDTGGLQEVEKG